MNRAIKAIKVTARKCYIYQNLSVTVEQLQIVYKKSQGFIGGVNLMQQIKSAATAIVKCACFCPFRSDLF